MPDGTKGYVNSDSLNQVLTFDPISISLTGSINVGNSPTRNAITPNGTFVYQTNFLSNDVSVIQTTTDTVIATIAVGIRPVGVAVSSDGTRTYVANSGGLSENISIIDTATQMVISTISLSERPREVTVSSDNTRLYASFVSGGGIASAIDLSTQSVIATISVGPAPRDVVASSDGLEIYVANDGSDNISIIDSTSLMVIATVSVGSSPFGIALFEPQIVADLEIEAVTADGDLISAAEIPSSDANFFHKNIFLTQIELFTFIRWSPPEDVQPSVYEIYRDLELTQLIAVIPSTSPLIFKDHNRKKGEDNTYVIVGIENDEIRALGSITLPGR